MSRKYDVQPGADEVAKWKAAVAEHNRSRRRNRWKRPGPAITGYVIQPPARGESDGGGRRADGRARRDTGHSR